MSIIIYVLLSLLLIAFVVQLGFYLIPYTAILRHNHRLRKGNVPHMVAQPPVSIIICARNEGDNLKVVFIRTGMTPKDIPANQVSVILGPDKANLSRFIARFRNGKLTRYVKKIDNVANKGQGDVYGNGSNAGTVKSPAPGVKLAPGEISVELTIPYSLFGKKPAPGDEWLFNATGDFTFPHVSYYTVWEYNFEQVTWRNTRDNQGRIKF